MKANLNKVLPENPFWNFSLSFYRKRQVEESLLQLQRRYGFNVNVVLYLLWYAQIGQGGLTQKKIRALLTLIAPWHNKVVLPLRRLRNQLTREHELYRSILEEELNAEHIEQTLMYEKLWIVDPKVRSQSQKVVDSCRSLASYCFLAHAKAENEMAILVVDLLCALYPTLPREDIEQVTAERLHEHPKMTKVSGTQLWIDI